MTSEERKIFEGFLSKTLNIDAEGMAALFNEAGELTNVEPLFDANAKKVALSKEISENQYKRGIKESREKLEKELKTVYGVDSDKQGSELVAEILTKETESIKAATSLKPEDIDKHPRFIEMRREFEKQMSTKEAEWSQKMEQEIGGIKYQYTVAKATGKAKELLAANKFVLPDNEKREKWLKVFESEIQKAYKYAENQNGDFDVLDESGNPMNDKHGNLLKFSDVVTGIAKQYFDVQSGEARSNAGNNGNANGQGANYNFKDKEDYRTAMNSATGDLVKQAEISKAWEGQNKK